MSSAWLQQRERGSLAALRLMTWITVAIGYRAAHALLAPICLYYLLSAPGARAASRDFLGRALGRPARLGEVYRHLRVFAGTLLDRVALLRGGTEGFDVRISGASPVEEILAARRGCLLLGSHLGSFEILRALGETRRHIVVNLVMQEFNAQRTARWARALAPELESRVIPAGRPETLLRVRECLERGEAVAMLGDRVAGGERNVACDFLGAPASFPTGPLLTASLLGAPVATFFCLARGPRRYDVQFELLAEHVGPKEGVAQWVQRYAARLEAQARANPWNWFNFYDFWQDG